MVLSGRMDRVAMSDASAWQQTEIALALGRLIRVAELNGLDL